MAMSSSLALGQDRFSSVSKTSFRAARSPPNIRVENHRNRGAATRGGRAAAAVGAIEPATQLLAGRDLRLFVIVLVGLLGLVFGFLQESADIVHFFFGELLQIAQALGHLAPCALPAFGGCEDEPRHRAEHDAEQKGAESSTALAHSPASASSGADTSAARGAACDTSFGLTYRSVDARVPFTRSCSNRNANVFSRSAPIAARTSSGRSQNRRFKGPFAFFRLFLFNCSSGSP